MMSERQIPGLTIAVAHESKIVWSEGFGYADLTRHSLACPDTQFRIASVSKVLTSVAMARLYQEGGLDLDVPIQRYVVGFPRKQGAITVRLLAEHRSGIRAYRNDLEGISEFHCFDALSSLGSFEYDPLVFRPDSRFLYSNYGYVLLSAAIEAASGENFLKYVREQVLKPLGMDATVEERAGEPTAHQASFYDNQPPYSLEGRTVPSPPNDFSCRLASGGFLSTAEDLTRLGLAFLPATSDPDFLKVGTIKLLTTPRSGLPPLAGYGMGLVSLRDLHLRTIYFHFGAGSGSTSLLAVYPHQRITLAILANLGEAKFPYSRLASIVNPFFIGIQPDQICFSAILLILVAIGLPAWKSKR